MEVQKSACSVCSSLASRAASLAHLADDDVFAFALCTRALRTAQVAAKRKLKPMGAEAPIRVCARRASSCARHETPG